MNRCDDRWLVEPPNDETAKIALSAINKSYALPRAVANQIRRLLGDHDRWRIRVAAHNRRHDRRVYDPQSLDTMHSEMGIDDRRLINSHLACAGRVPSRGGSAPNEGLDIRVAPQLRSRRYLHATDVVEGLGVQNPEVPAHTSDGASHIVGRAQVVEIDHWSIKRIGRSKCHLAAAEWSTNVGGEGYSIPVWRPG